MSQPDWSKAPEGATHWSPNENLCSQFLRLDKGVWHWHTDTEWESYDPPARHLAGVVERPNAEWSGTGLPPVGTVCECSWNSGSGTYEKAKVVAHDDDRAVFKWLTGSRPGTYQAADACGLHGGRVPQFRPIRTQEQIAADERKDGILGMVGVFGKDTSIWGLDSVREICAFLYDDGYRKQSTKQDGE